MERTARGLVEGTPVFTSDGKEVGHVTEIVGEAFRVGVSWHPDFWLAIESVDAASAERAVLRFDHDHLKGSRVANPHWLNTEGLNEATTLIGTEDELSLAEREDRGLSLERHHIR